MLPGIDVSNYQSRQIPIDWDAVAASGVKWAGCLFTDGYIDEAGAMFVNPWAERDWSEMGRVGLGRVAFHFYRGNGDPGAQAAHFLGHLLPVMAPGDIAAGDFEEGTGNIAEGADTFLQAVQAAVKHTPWLYTGLGAGQSRGLFSFTPLARYPLWFANWNPGEPQAPAPWGKWVAWQQGQGTVPGVTGPVDTDVFDGTLDQLRAMGMPGSSTSDPRSTLSDLLYGIRSSADEALTALEALSG